MLELVLEKLERDVEGLFCRFNPLVEVRSKMVVMWRLSMVHWAGIRIDVVMQVAIDPLINLPSDVSPAIGWKHHRVWKVMYTQHQET